MKKKFVEWQTMVLIGLLYASWFLLTLGYHYLPWWIVVPFGACVIALYGSVQHEVIHGHPTRWQFINEALVFPSPWLWLPYPLYRDSHIQHHKNELITDPFDDPESYYVSAEQWDNMNRFHQFLFIVRNTLAGRLLIGPFWIVAAFLLEEARLCLTGDQKRIRIWVVHFFSIAATLWWINYCDISLLEYSFLIVYPGVALTLLRSFLEHQAVTLPQHRTVIVSSSSLFSLLFLNNNLHALHHEQPGLAWYKLPGVWHTNRDEILKRNGGYYYDGYRSLFKNYLFATKTHPRHPDA